jgi:hypothetical protein
VRRGAERQSERACAKRLYSMLNAGSQQVGVTVRRMIMRRIFAVLAGLVCAFFIFYTIRLLVVTAFLTRLRPGGGGARIGAVAFPLIALFFGWGALRLWRGARTPNEAAA